MLKTASQPFQRESLVQPAAITSPKIVLFTLLSRFVFLSFPFFSIQSPLFLPSLFLLMVSASLFLSHCAQIHKLSSQKLKSKMRRHEGHEWIDLPGEKLLLFLLSSNTRLFLLHYLLYLIISFFLTSLFLFFSFSFTLFILTHFSPLPSLLFLLFFPPRPRTPPYFFSSLLP